MAARPPAPAPPSDRTQTVICMKWGDLFSADYVNRLHAGVMRHVTRPTRFIVFTDDPTGLAPGIEPRPIPDIALPEQGLRRGPWKKLALWSDRLGLEGDVLFLDLDLVLTGSIDALFDYRPGEFCILRNWTQKDDGVGNTSVMRFRAGSAPHLVDWFLADPIRNSFKYTNEQTFVSRHSGMRMHFWPHMWCPSFKHDLLPPFPSRLWRDVPLPRNSRIVVFTGDPRPHEALAGSWPVRHWRKAIYKRIRPVRWIADHWRV